jgi:hypothetical protein
LSSIDFQNGFISGLATKGLVRSGEYYKPICWNDEGVYSYFYIDFLRAMETFTQGMFNESIIIHDSEQLYITGVQQISTSVYKFYCNIAGRVQGITVLNKKTSMLTFATGEQLPVFSVHFFVAGIDSYFRLKYCYGAGDFEQFFTSATDSGGPVLWDAFSIDAGGEVGAFGPISSTITTVDTESIVLI